jgi:CRP/FNR family transcriptional regulator, anaerobic regulatory protein
MQDFINEIEKAFPDAVQLKVVERNNYIITPGQIEQNIYWVVNGAFKIYYQSAFEEHVLRFAYKNSTFMAIDSYINRLPSRYFIQAIKKSTIKTFPIKNVKEFISENKERLAQYNYLLESLILQQMEREIDLLIQSPIERYNRVLKRSPQLFQEIPNKHIAAYLRMSPETLSRLKKS